MFHVTSFSLHVGGTSILLMDFLQICFLNVDVYLQPIITLTSQMHISKKKKHFHRNRVGTLTQHQSNTMIISLKQANYYIIAAFPF